MPYFRSLNKNVNTEYIYLLSTFYFVYMFKLIKTKQKPEF